MAAMGFGIISGRWWPPCTGPTQHPLSFTVSPCRAVPITFSVQKPFLLRLEDVLPGVSFHDFEERVDAYVDDVVVVGEE